MWHKGTRHPLLCKVVVSEDRFDAIAASASATTVVSVTDADGSASTPLLAASSTASLCTSVNGAAAVDRCLLSSQRIFGTLTDALDSCVPGEVVVVTHGSHYCGKPLSVSSAVLVVPEGHSRSLGTSMSLAAAEARDDEWVLGFDDTWIVVYSDPLSALKRRSQKRNDVRTSDWRLLCDRVLVLSCCLIMYVCMYICVLPEILALLQTLLLLSLEVVPCHACRRIHVYVYSRSSFLFVSLLVVTGPWFLDRV
jgi:hypothetical protein